MAFSPAVQAYENPGFGVAYWNVGEGVSENHYMAFGNWEYKAYRGAFRYSYGELDSIYCESRANLEGAFLWKYFGFGGGYGFSMEWVPGDAFWTRHFYDVGLLAHYENLTFGFSLMGFTDETPEPLATLYWRPSSGLRLLVQGNRQYVNTGYELCFSHLCLESAFRTPSFAVFFGGSVSFGGWNAGGKHLFGGEDLDQNVFWLHKSIQK